jgi:hypothetical protein
LKARRAASGLAAGGSSSEPVGTPDDRPGQARGNWTGVGRLAATRAQA